MTLDWNPQPPYRPPSQQSSAGCLRGLIMLVMSALLFGSAGYFARPSIDRWLNRNKLPPSTSVLTPRPATEIPVPIPNSDLSISANSAFWSNDINSDETPEIAALDLHNGTYDLILLDGESGAVLWRTSLGGDYSYIAPVGEQILIFKDQQVKAYRIDNGTFLWEGQLPDRAQINPSVIFQTPQLLAIQSYDNQITAFERVSGKQAWQLQLPDQYATTLTRIGDDVCDVERNEQTNTNIIQCYSLANAAKSRQFDLQKEWTDDVVWWLDPRDSSVMYRLYSSREPPVLEQVQLSDNSIAWSQPISEDFTPYRASDMVIAYDQQRIAMSYDDQIAIVAPQSYTTIKQTDMMLLPLGMSENTLYSLAIKQRGTNTASIAAFDLTTQQQQWSSPVLSNWSSSSDIKESWLFVPNQGVIAGTQDPQNNDIVKVQLIKDDGTIGWTWQRTMFIGQRPKITRAANRLLVNNVDGIAVLDLQTGAVKWEIVR